MLAFIEIGKLGQSNFSSFFSYSPGLGYRYLPMITAIITFFFAFGGFEAVAAQVEEIENSKQKITSILLYMLVLVFIFYLFYYFVLGGALGAGSGQTSLQAPANNGAVGNLMNKLLALVFTNRGTATTTTELLGSAAGVAFFVFAVVAQFAAKTSSRMQCG